MGAHPGAGLSCPGALGSLLGPHRDRSALCQLWRAIILRDDAAMKAHAATLGVQGEAGACGYTGM